MTVETFFENFNQFADAPDAIAKMRELVLELAVRGRLIGNAEPSASSHASDPFRIPGHWNWSNLRDVSGPCGQKKPDSRFTYVDVGAIDNVRGRITDAVQQLEAADAPSRARKLVEPGSVLYATVRPYLRNVAVFERQFTPPAIVSTAFAVLHPREILEVRFLFYWLRSQSFQYVVTEKMKGVAYPAISDSEFWSCPIPLPPVAEQKRIVAKVDELIALCDRLEAQQQERDTRHAELAQAALARFADASTPANLQLLFQPSYAISPADLRKSILALAVQGKLVPQATNDEPAATLLTRISQKKQAMIAAKKIRQGKVSRPHSALDAPTQLPRGWEWVNVDTLCFKVTDGTHFTPQYAASGVRFVSAKDIVSGRLVFDRCKFITQEEHEQLYRRCNPEYHDIVISKSGSIGTVALVKDREEFSLFESLALLKYDQACLFPGFLVCALSHACASLTAGHIRGVGVKHLHLDILRGLEIALPPLREQRRIVAKVDELMGLVDTLETQLAASRAIAANLLPAAVAELTAAG